MNGFSHFAARHALSLALVISALGLTAPLVWAADVSVATDKPTSLRISASQYRQTISDIFGPSISINARFDPDPRDNGLLAIGALNASVSESGLERYDDIAKEVAAQVVDARHRDVLISCKPRSPGERDDACARAFIAAAGRLLYRRP